MAHVDNTLIDAILIEAAEEMVREAGLKDTAAAWKAIFFKSLDAWKHHTGSREFREDLVRFSNMTRRMADEIQDLG